MPPMRSRGQAGLRSVPGGREPKNDMGAGRSNRSVGMNDNGVLAASTLEEFIDLVETHIGSNKWRAEKKWKLVESFPRPGDEGRQLCVN